MKAKKKEVTEKTEEIQTEKAKKKLKVKAPKGKDTNKKKKPVLQISENWEEIIPEKPTAEIVSDKADVEQGKIKQEKESQGKDRQGKERPKNKFNKFNKFKEKRLEHIKPDIKPDIKPAEVKPESADDDLLFEEQPKWDPNNPKIWNGDKIDTFHQDTPKKTFFKKNKGKPWNKNKPGFMKKRPEQQQGGENRPRVWSNNTNNNAGESTFGGGGYSNQFGQNKKKFFGKKNKKFQAKKKPILWEDRKPRFWSEGKANTRLNSKNE